MIAEILSLTLTLTLTHFFLCHMTRGLSFQCTPMQCQDNIAPSAALSAQPRHSHELLTLAPPQLSMLSSRFTGNGQPRLQPEAREAGFINRPLGVTVAMCTATRVATRCGQFPEGIVTTLYGRQFSLFAVVH